MMNGAGFTREKRDGLWTEAANTATKLTNMTVTEAGREPPHKLFFGQDAAYARHLRTFGEMAVTAIHKNKRNRSKLDDRGRTCIFIGYADDHAGDVYRFFNMKTRKVLH